MVNILGVLHCHGLVDAFDNDNGFDAAIHQSPKSLRPVLDLFSVEFLTGRALWIDGIVL